MFCKNLDKEQTQILEVEKKQEGNDNQKRHDELDKRSFQKPAQSWKKSRKTVWLTNNPLQEGSTRLASVNEKQPILSACKFLLLYNQIHLGGSRSTLDLTPDEVSFSGCFLGRIPLN